MKVKIQAGAEIDTLTKDELHGALRDWMVETMRGAVPIRFDGWGVVAGTALTIDGNNNQGRIGPEAGMFWLVTRLAVVGLTNASEVTNVYVNAVQARNLVFPLLTGFAGSTGYHEFSSAQCMLTGNDRLIVQSSGVLGTANGSNVVLTGAAWELPIGLVWKLLG